MANNSFDVGPGYEQQETSAEANGDMNNRSPSKRFRGKGMVWLKKQEFNTKEEAINFIQNEATWSVDRSYDSKEGHKVRYRCNKVKWRADDQCPAQIQLVYYADRTTVGLYQTDNEHDHTNKPRCRGIEPVIRNAILELYHQGIRTPKPINATLRLRGLKEVPVQQLNNFIQIYKRQVYEPLLIKMDDFKTFCDIRLTRPTDDWDKAFIIKYESGSNEAKETWIRVAMTTPRLLQIARQCSILHADAIYKINWNRLPLILVGTADKNRSFHPLILGLCSNETAQDFEFVFQSLADSISELDIGEITPRALVAGEADTITDGFAAVFGANFKRITCWSHVIRAVDYRLKKINNSEQRQRIRDDICELRLCPSPETFHAASTLFLTKWYSVGNDEINAFLNYFAVQWISANNGWYEGYCLDVPSTNESTDNCIRVDGTLRNRLPLTEFMVFMEKLVASWSKERNPAVVDCKSFAAAPVKTTALWKTAFQWTAQSRQILSKAIGTALREYYIPAIDDEVINAACINEYKAAFFSNKWPSFGEYSIMRNSLYVVSVEIIDVDDGGVMEDWENATCNCPAYLKSYVCKHVLGLAIRRKHYSVPDIVKKLETGQTRKRGRPCSAGFALERDDDV